MIQIVLLLLISVSNAIMMDIPANSYRCISEDVFEGQVIHGTFGLAEGSNLYHRTVTFKIFGEQGQELLVEEIKENHPKNKFAFTPDEEAMVDFCFVDTSKNSGNVPIRVYVDIKTGFQEKVSTNYAPKMTIDNIEEYVDASFKSANYIVEYLKECQKIEYERRDMNEAINARTLWFSIIIIIIVIAFTFIQGRVLRSFFLRRKLI